MKKVSAFFLSFCLVSAGVSVIAASSRAEDPVNVAASTKPKALNEVGITERLGETVSIQSLRFRDETGTEVPLSKYFESGKPVVLTMSYYNCPGLCGVVLNALTDSMRGLDWTLGSQYVSVNVSIDSKEGPELAAEKKKNYIKSLGRPEADKGWHFLVGSEENIQQLAREVGFGFKWVPEENQYAHAAAAYVLTPEGKISRILYGIQYRSSDLKLSLLEASNGKIGTIIDRLILFCYQYDPQMKKYSLGITRVVQVGAIATTLFLGLYIGLLWLREKKREGSSGVLNA